MDALRFDTLTKSWIAVVSRRRTLAGVLAGVLGTLGRSHAEDADAAKSGKCKKTCGECEFCKKGKCRNKHGKKRCKSGKCKPVERGTPCSGGSGNCRCIQAIEGVRFCADEFLVVCLEGDCSSSAECPSGRRCIRCGDPGGTACVPECGTV